MVKKAILPIAGLGTRFLPLSKTVPKEFLPLDSKPVIHYIVEEALQAGVKEFIFVISPEKREVFKKYILEYFGKEKKRFDENFERKGKGGGNFDFKKHSKDKVESGNQKEPRGDGDAILKAEKFIKKSHFWFYSVMTYLLEKNLFLCNWSRHTKNIKSQFCAFIGCQKRPFLLMECQK
jgi:UTP--glucose-1-phosphate uridylyltransferase